MRITTQAKNLDLTDDIRSYISKITSSIEKMVDENDETIICDIEVGRETGQHTGKVFYAEANLMLPKRDLLRSTATEETLTAALDKVKEEILQELRKDKTRRLSFSRRQAARVKEVLKSIYGRF